jgi:aminomethyltransferase
MPIPSPFHERTFALSASLRFKDWAGYYAVCSYDTCHEREYYAFRHAAGLLDVTPLFKYEVTGRDAALLLARVMVRDIRKLKPGRVTYACFCDDDGKVLDDGTVTCLEPNVYRVTAAEPSFRWLSECARGFEVRITDTTETLGALALQGPNAREVLRAASDANLDALKFFQHTRARLDGIPVEITRTGYTGDLGYEIWMDNAHALKVWDALMSAGRPFGLEAVGLDALDVTRIEAGFIMAGVDYYPANRCTIESRKTSPYEIDLGWCVNLDRDPPFIGQAALRAEKQRGSARAFVGLEIDWEELERLYDAVGLPPGLSSAAWRTPIPVYDAEGSQVGRATSGVWSPVLKKNLALALVRSELGSPGTQLRIEQTVEFARHQVTATVVPKPFFDPERKKA